MNTFLKSLESGENYSNEFKELMSQIPSSVAIVAVSTSDGFQACTISSFISVDVLDPTVMFVLKNESGTLKRIQENNKFSINLLLAGQHELSKIYSSLEKKSEIAFKANWKTTKLGVPILIDCKSFLVCQTFSVKELPSATVVFAQVIEFELRSQNLPLIYYSRSYPRITGN
jgi:flavin reductase (DIM6/NTAB) family NADH-FMN oxidoreductase RutF